MNLKDIISVAKHELKGILKSKTILIVALIIPFAVTFLSIYSIVFSFNSAELEDERKLLKNQPFI